MGDEGYRNSSAPTGERLSDLLGRMTLEEKLAQLGSYWSHEILDHETFDPAKAAERIGKGIGQITRVAGATNLGQRAVAELANEIQRFLLERTRLGIPAIVHEECLHGLLARESVCFPQSIGQAASWEPELVHAMASRLGRQLRAAGAQQALCPILDITRDPRWGRIEETYGEDPYLVAELGAAYVRGLQGDGAPEERVIATGKHMVGHGLPEGGLNHAPSHIGPRELEDAFLFPFEAAVRDAGLRSVMHAYDDVDGMPCVASKALLTDTLRGRWGFDGTVVSDYFGIDELLTSHAMTSDRSVAAALSLEAGVDVELPTTRFYAGPLADAIAAGGIEMTTVDRAVARVLQAKFELGLFEKPYVVPDSAEVPFAEDRALAREIARRSIVLLANDGKLPLGTDIGTVAVIGPTADDARNLLGDYAHVAHIEALIEMGGFGAELPEGLAVADELAGHGTILDAIRGRLDGDAEVRFAAGCGILDGDDEGIRAAAAAANGADVAIVVVGERPDGHRLARAPERVGGGSGGHRNSDHPGSGCGTPAGDRVGGGRVGCGRSCLGAGRGRPRGHRRCPFRRLEPGWQAAGHRPATDRPDPDLLRSQAVRWPVELEGPIRRRLESASLAVRLRAVLHAV